MTRDEFDPLFAELCAAYDKPLTDDRRNAYWQAFKDLHPDAWLRMVTHCRGETAPEKFPTVRDLWNVRRSLSHRARAPEAAATIPADTWRGDRWDEIANTRLLQYVTKQLPRRPHKLGGTGIAAEGGKLQSTWTDGHAEAVAVLVQVKNVWAIDMREQSPPPTPEYQAQQWDELMANAEAEIARIRRRAKAAAAKAA